MRSRRTQWRYDRRPMAAPVLVTGMMRTGTTWVGRMLCASGRLSYISEPLNPHHPGIFRLPVTYNYTYISPENEHEFLPTFRDAVELRPRPFRELASARSPADVRRVGLTTFEMLRGRVTRAPPVQGSTCAVLRPLVRRSPRLPRRRLRPPPRGGREQPRSPRLARPARPAACSAGADAGLARAGREGARRGRARSLRRP